MAVDLSKFTDLFVSETEDHIELLNKNLLLLEKDMEDIDVLNELMRSAHTIKGASATMQFKKLAFLTHVMEDVFDYARSGNLKLNSEIMDKIFFGLDNIEKSLDSIKKNGKELDLDEISEEIKEITGVETEGVGKSVRDKSGKPIVKKKGKKSIKKGKVSKKISAQKEKEVIEKIEEMSHIKVPVERLDNLMSLMEELLIDKMKLQLIIDNEREDSTRKESGQKTSILRQILPIIEHLNRLISDIQFQVMEARLVPVEQIFARFPRMVRDLASTQKKKIDFDVMGGNLELDRTIIDKLANPLVHLLRNAVDHGIEKEGKIYLRAMREKNYSIIAVENTSGNINWKKVVNKARERSIISSEKENELLSAILKVEEQMSGKSGEYYVYPAQMNEVKSLIFNPNLSTKEKVTETSGRGVGLSVVKGFVEQIGGRVSVESPLPGNGTRFVMELPSRLALIKALMVSVKDSVFAIPFASIDRSVSIKQTDVKSMADQDVAVVEENHVPLVDLENVFGLGSDSKSKDKNNDKTVVLVEYGKETAGVVVDKLLSEQEIIVKPLSSVLRDVKGFSGSTILGDGKTVLILDIASLLEDSSSFVRTNYLKDNTQKES